MERVNVVARYVTQAALAASTAVATVISFSTPASATAVGYAKVVGFCFDAQGTQLCLPATTLGHFVQGSGRHIDRQEASVQDAFGIDSAGGAWCNWRIDYRYSDLNGRTYLVSRGQTHTRCTAHSSIGRVDRTHHTLKHYG
ncbi:hypothetical protein ACFWVC_16385 [Streptomyces sp. NPDC058691]|uniref:hypothetical protein n=1 Tax=Streptomyces sp. NPDC058691 TaxID=3346601 RepID=UPI003667D9BE